MAGTVQILRNTPPAALLPGALSVELGTPTRLWVGASGGNKLLFSNAPTDAPVVGAFWVLKSGDTMTGPLVLAGPPALPLHAATKAYADLKLPIAGGTMTGPLILSGPPTDPFGAATKGYIDGAFLPLTGGTLTGPLTIRFPDSGYQAVFAGTTMGMRFVTNTVGSAIEGVDQTGFGFFRPLTLGGSLVQFSNSGVVVGRFQPSGFTTFNTSGTQTGGFDSSGWVLGAGGRRIASNDGNYTGINDGAGRGALALGGTDPTNYYRNGTHRFENINGSSYYGQITNGNLYLAGSSVFFQGATSAGPQLRADNTNGYFRVGSGNGSFVAESSTGQIVGGFRSDGWVLSLDGRATISNNGSGAAIKDGPGRDSIILNPEAIYYRSPAHQLQSVAGGATYMTVDNGAVTAFRFINATAGLSVTGNLNVTDAIISNKPDRLAFWAPNGGITVAGEVNCGSINTNSSTINCGNISAVGNVVAAGALASENGVWAFTAGNTYFGHGLGRDGSGNPFVTLQTDCALTFQTSTGLAWWGAGGIIWVMGTQCFNNVGPVGGHGSYFDLSDSRLKTDIEPATAGLAEILKLKPMLFKRLWRADSSIFGEPSPRQEMGFVAEDVAEALPIAVGEVELEDGPALTVSTTPILAAVVTALREIDQRLKTLEGA